MTNRPPSNTARHLDPTPPRFAYRELAEGRRQGFFVKWKGASDRPPPSPDRRDSGGPGLSWALIDG